MVSRNGIIVMVIYPLTIFDILQTMTYLLRSFIYCTNYLEKKTQRVWTIWQFSWGTWMILFPSFFQVIVTKSRSHPFFDAVVVRELRSLKNLEKSCYIQSEFPTCSYHFQNSFIIICDSWPVFPWRNRTPCGAPASYKWIIIQVTIDISPINL